MRVTSGESEPERRRRTPLPLVSPRSTKEKKRAVRPSTRSPDEPEKIPRYSCVLGVREFMAVLAVIGPLGTLISLWVLPQGELMDQLPSMRARHMRNRGEGASRVIHLTMADNERKARFVLGADLDWDQFIGGVQERLQLASIARIETEAGEGIMSVEDLMHEDHLVIYSDAPLKRRERGSLLFRSEEEEDLDEDYDDEFESRGRRGPRRRVRPADALAEEAAGAANILGAPILGSALRRASSADGELRLLRRQRAGVRSAVAKAAAAAEAKVGAGGGGASGGAKGRSSKLEELEDPAWAERGMGESAAERGADPRQTKARGGRSGKVSRRQPSREELEEEVEDEAEADAELEEAAAMAEAREEELEAARARLQEKSKEFVKQQEKEAESFKHMPPADEPGGCGGRHKDFRLGMIIPWVGPLPLWSNYFMSSAALSAPIADFLVFHEAQTHAVPHEVPSNVKLHDLGVGGLAQLFGLQLGEALELPIRNASVLIKAMRFMFDKWPRLVAEYKPAFGAIFAAHLKPYTHWGYCDLDMVIGNLPLFIERQEFSDYDVVTYSFGDQEALYLRGQWTLHRNVPWVAGLWKECAHLGAGLQKELLLKVAWVRRMESRGIQNYPKRFQSAEGCYSQRAVARDGIRMRMANKQFVGLTVDADYVIYSVDGAVWQCPRDASVEIGALARHSMSGRCSEQLPGVQTLVGEPRRVAVSGEGCGKWMPLEYRMCATELIADGAQEAAGQAVTYFDGAFYAQRFQSAAGFVMANGCRQGAFFHFQEWKKAWSGHFGGATTGIEPVGDGPRYSARPRNFSVSPEGISVLATGSALAPAWPRRTS